MDGWSKKPTIKHLNTQKTHNNIYLYINNVWRRRQDEDIKEKNEDKKNKMMIIVIKKIVI